MKVPERFSTSLSLGEQILYVVSGLKEATTNGIVTELIELQGIAAEDALEDLTFEVRKELDKMLERGLIKEAESGGKPVYTAMVRMPG